MVAIGELNGIVETLGGAPVDVSKVIQPAEFYSSLGLAADRLWPSLIVAVRH